MNPENNFSTMSPAALPPELGARFLEAMLAASHQDADAEMLARLRRLQPARLGARRQSRLARAMESDRPAPVHFLHHGRRYVCRWAGAAAVLALLGSAVVFMMPGSAVAAATPSGYARRNIIESRTGNVVMWQDGQVPMRTSEVLYEDSLILEGEDNMSIEVRVPNRATVLIEDEVI